MTDYECDEILGRFKQVTNTEKDIDLSSKIGLSKQSISAARKKCEIPATWFFIVAEKYNVSIDWLYHGTGSQKNYEPYKEQYHEVVDLLSSNQEEIEGLKEENTILLQELRELNKENRQLLREMVELKEELGRLRERLSPQHKEVFNSNVA